MSTPVIRRSPVHSAVVVAATSVTPRMRRVTVRAESLVGLELRPAQDVELHLVEPAGRRVKRRYTIRAARPADGEIDLDVALHGAGPGAGWGESAAPGDPVSFQGPRGKLELRPAPAHLLVGDESALPAIAVICSALPAGEVATAVIEVQDGTDEQSLDAASVTWAHRGASGPGTPDHLLPAVAAVLDGGIAVAGARAYLLGETRTMVAIRALLESRGFDHESIFLKGYWNQGRPDRIRGERPAS